MPSVVVNSFESELNGDWSRLSPYRVRQSVPDMATFEAATSPQVAASLFVVKTCTLRLGG
jgi:hypothetical protein